MHKSLRRMTRILFPALGTLFMLTQLAQAATIPVSENLRLFDDRNTFFAATNAVQITNGYNFGVADTNSSGAVFFNSRSGSFESTPLIEGREIAFSGVSDFTAFIGLDIFSLGFEVYDFNPVPNPLFDITLFNDSVLVGRYQFSLPLQVLRFIGVQSPVAFNRVVFDEVGGDSGNEVFGQFYGGQTPLNPVPVPAAMPMLLAAIGGLGFLKFRKKKFA